MTQANTAAVTNLFKKVYSKIVDLQPQDYNYQQVIPFKTDKKVGESYSIAAVLTSESGLTLGGSGTDLFNLNPAVAGAVKQALVVPSISVLASAIPWAVLSRSTDDEASFRRALDHIVKNNLKSHGKYREFLRIYGQAAEKCGYVYYGTETFRDVAFTNGTGTLTLDDGSTIAFTNGINAAAKAILLGRDWAPGLWVGSEGLPIKQVDASNVVVGQGKVLGIDASFNILYVDFTPVAASSLTSHSMAIDGMEVFNENIGIKKILLTSGSLFGISTSAYSLWKGNVQTLSSVKITFDRIGLGVSKAVNRGGLDKDLFLDVNPRSWNTLVSTEAGRRMYDESYKPTEAEQGFEAIVFHSQNGKIVIRSNRMIKEKDAIAIARDDWERIGSSEVSMSVPGSGEDKILFQLENQAGMAFRTYCDEAMFCHAPARSILYTGINDESAT